MIDVFSKEEKAAAFRTKKVLFWTWFAVLMAVLAVIGVMIGINIYRVEVYRDRTYSVLMGVISGIIGTGFAFYSMFFFSIKYRLTRKYVKMLKDMDRGLRDVIEATFMGYDDQISMKDGVFFYSMMLKAKPLKRDDICERKLLIEHTVPKIPLIEGTRLKIVSHANILISYEILSVPEPAPQSELQGEQI